MYEDTGGEGEGMRGHQEREEPIAALKDFQIATSPSFLGKIRRKIHRRENVAKVISASMELPGIVFIELAKPGRLCRKCNTEDCNRNPAGRP